MVGGDLGVSKVGGERLLAHDGGDAAGELVAVPYSRYFSEPLGRAAKLLREAA